MCHIDTMEFSHDNKQEGISTDASPSANLENILLSERCLSQSTAYFAVIYIFCSYLYTVSRIGKSIETENGFLGQGGLQSNSQKRLNLARGEEELMKMF